jgi:hypothetical protein
VAQLLAAFEQAMEAAGMQEEAKAKALLQRLRYAGTDFAQDGPSHATEAFNAFVVLWGRVYERLQQQRAALPHKTADAAVVAIRAYLQDIGLGECATAVIDAKSAQPLHDRLDRLLKEHNWTGGTLQAAGQELEQKKAQTTQMLAPLSGSLRIAPLDLAPDIGIVKTQAEERVKQLEATLQRLYEAVSLQQTITEVEGLLRSLPRVEALAVKHENAILALWGAFVEGAASSST